MMCLIEMLLASSMLETNNPSTLATKQAPDLEGDEEVDLREVGVQASGSS